MSTVTHSDDSLRHSRQLPQEQDGCFLCVRFRIAQINRPMVSKTINSSYVLIIITTFRQDFGTGESTSPGCPGKHISYFDWTYIRKYFIFYYNINVNKRMLIIFALTLPDINGINIQRNLWRRVSTFCRMSQRAANGGKAVRKADGNGLLRASGTVRKVSGGGWRPLDAEQ